MAEPSDQLSVTLRLGLDCQVEAVRPAVLRVVEFLKDQHVAAEEIQACELALVEASNNAVQYAREEARVEPVRILVSCGAERIEFRIEDHTPGFTFPPTVDLPEPDQERGRGLFLIRCLMDRADYLRGENGNCLVMEKRRRRTTDSAMGVQNLGQMARYVAESEQIIRDMSEELSFCYESLSAIFRCSAELGRTHNVEEFCQRLLSDLTQITGADWFLLRVLKNGTRLAVLTASERASHFPALPLSKLTDTHRSAEVQAALSRQDVWFDREQPLGEKDPLQGVQSNSVGFVHPIYFGDRLIGTITIGKPGSGAPFTAVHANVVHTFADFLATQIVNVQLQEEQVHSRLLSHELEIAKNIQRSLLPKSLPELPGYGLAGYCESARQVGGDFYDVVKIDDQSALLIIADVMGKGMPAAMFAAVLRSLLRAVPEWTSQPAALLGRANRLLFEELSGVDMFITAQLAYVDTAQRHVITASAGHCPLLVSVADSAGAQVKTVAPEGLPLGIMADATFTAHTESLSSDSRVLLYTDGLTEARNADGELFGQERLMEWFSESVRRHPTAEALKDHLANYLNQFQCNAAPSDDQTFLVMA
ncbi:MAG: SpoIIE family protein phosphatase [Verrucomicrobiales bacterium]|nr:SpoIIE family protein phosphatase [Verrucomicrobiales bacterium]